MQKRKPYEVFEHTADVGIEAFGHTLPELFIHAAQGMESLMVAPEQIQESVTREVAVEGSHVLSLLIAWLNELIIMFDTDYLLFRTFAISTFTETSLRGLACGEPYNPERHELSSAIKAVTWHQASVERTEDGYKVRIIFDI